MNDNIKAGSDIHAGDGGYSIGTQEKYDEFVKIRNQSLGKMRIRELAEQATTIEYGVDNGFDRVTFDKEKFAELIMRETFNWVVDNVGLMEETEWHSLKKHFGVEE